MGNTLMSVNNAVKTLYELYKIDWMTRISSERQMDAIKNYYEEAADDVGNIEYANSNRPESFDAYIEEVGYDGEIYACFDEFCDNELEDSDYIYGLIGECEPLKEAYDIYLNEAEREH